MLFHGHMQQKTIMEKRFLERFVEKELQKTNQTEQRAEKKKIKRKGDKLYIKQIGYDNSFNS